MEIIFNNVIREFHGKKFLLAISGGVDSMVLLHLFLSDVCIMKEDMLVCHVNYALRETDSDEDEKFVRNHCKAHGIRFISEKYDTLALSRWHHTGIQETARNLRYTLFERICREAKLDFIVTAHHQDDQIETVLFNIFRGTGFGGLTGMSVRNGRILRPLLEVSKERISLFASEKKIPFREDSSNVKNEYSRNYIRNVLLPDLEGSFPNVRQKMLGNIYRWQNAIKVYESLMMKELEKAVEKRGEAFFIPIGKLKKYKPLMPYLFELFKPFGLGEKQCEEVIKLLDAQSGKRLETKEWDIVKDRKFLIVQGRKNMQKNDLHWVEYDDGEIDFGQGKLVWKIESAGKFKPSADQNTVCLDAGMISFPWLLRPMRLGDYFYPLGLNKKKKIARFLTDRKLSRLDKEKIYVLEQDKKILWVVGQQIDHRFRVTEKTRNIIRIKWTAK